MSATEGGGRGLENADNHWQGGEGGQANADKADKGGEGGQANADNHWQGGISCMCQELFPITTTMDY